MGGGGATVVASSRERRNKRNVPRWFCSHRVDSDVTRDIPLLFVGKILLRVKNVVSQSVRVCAYFVSALELRACVCVRCPIYSGIECFTRPGDASSSAGVMKKEEG
ncbi:unnamed protein product, partial [Ectocarpus sp. 12 AP-2014]